MRYFYLNSTQHRQDKIDTYLINLMTMYQFLAFYWITPSK